MTLRILFCAMVALYTIAGATAQQPASPVPETASAPPYQIDVPNIRQGRVGLAHISQELVAEPVGRFLEDDLTFFKVPGNTGWYAFLYAPLTQAPKSYPLTVRIDEEIIEVPVDVTSGGFIQQQVIVVGEGNNLLNRELEDAELQRLQELSTPVTEVVYWQDYGFVHPVDTELTSPFGAQRVFNGLYESLHTGWDYNAPTGKPVAASAPGIVVFAGRLDIRGNYVLIDHGYGIYTGYAHLSVVHVTQGQEIYQGQIVGQVGTTGRSSSAHLHFEMLYRGNWADSADFIALNLPR
jgi:murein DD-endopeptidase MepM/ murein hydrolase activator NlpD